MGSVYGQLTDFAIGFQNSFGTQLTNSLYFLPFLNESLSIDKPPLTSEAMRGILDEGSDLEGANSIGGDVEVEAQPVALGVLLKAVMGEPSTVTSSGVYTHTFEPRTDDFDKYIPNIPCTIYKYFNTGSAELFYDQCGSMLEMGIANGEYLKTKVSFVGANHSQLADVAASYPVGKRFTWDISSVSIGGTAKPEVAALTISLDEGGIEGQHTLSNSRFPSRIKRTGFRTLSVDGTLKFDDQDEYQQFLSQSERELILHFESNVEIQSGYNESLTIKLPLLRYREAKPNAGGAGVIELPITAAGKYSANSATALQIVLVNSQAAY